jgi:hypothetical protein
LRARWQASQTFALALALASCNGHSSSRVAIGMRAWMSPSSFACVAGRAGFRAPTFAHAGFARTRSDRRPMANRAEDRDMLVTDLAIDPVSAVQAHLQAGSGLASGGCGRTCSGTLTSRTRTLSAQVGVPLGSTAGIRHRPRTTRASPDAYSRAASQTGPSHVCIRVARPRRIRLPAGMIVTQFVKSIREECALRTSAAARGGSD